MNDDLEFDTNTKLMRLLILILTSLRRVLFFHGVVDALLGFPRK